MGMITRIRAPLPVTETPFGPPEPRAPGAVLVGAAGPVAKTVLRQAVQQAPAKPGTGDPRLLEARLTTDTSAAAAAEAARAAYIRASIAAGISPLPLP